MESSSSSPEAGLYGIILRFRNRFACAYTLHTSPAASYPPSRWDPDMCTVFWHRIAFAPFMW
jgi:hypothetical protein